MNKSNRERFYELANLEAQLYFLERLNKIETTHSLNIDIPDYIEKRIKQLKNEIDEHRDFNKENVVLLDDSLNILSRMKKNSVDLCLSDIPYGINLDEWDVFHDNTNSAFLGSSEAQEGKSGFKRRGKPINGWNKEDRLMNQKYEDWVYSWALMLFDVMKEGAPVLLFGARRTQYSVLKALEKAGFLIKDVLAWKKNAAHHRSQDIFRVLARRGRFYINSKGIEELQAIIGDDAQELNSLIDKKYDSSRQLVADIKKISKNIHSLYIYEILEVFQIDPVVKEQIEKWKGWKLGNLAPIYEPIAWVFKPYTTVTLTDNVLLNEVGAMNYNKSLIDGKSPTNLLEFGFSKEESGSKFHEALKPQLLLEYLIELTTIENSLVLDMFMGSGSTVLAAKNTSRKYIGIEINENYYNIACERIKGMK